MSDWDEVVPRGEEAFKNYVAESFRRGGTRMAQLETLIGELRAELNTNSALTKKTNADAAEFLEIFKAMKGGFKVLGWLGALAKWVAAIAGGGAIVALVFGWRWPGK